jgi:peptide/nickel transport system ATP-binding protein/oligopeptide transport system ATP-binding protein
VSDDLLVLDDVVKHFRAPARRVVRAVDGVSFAVGRGETVALVGESGSGKSTVARLVLRLVSPTHGTVTFTGRRVQMVFQDPYSSLDPRMTARAAVAEPLVVARRRRVARTRVPALFDAVGLGGEHLARYPHELSGGQRQRVAIARALALDPDLVVLDEPVTSLDVSTRAQILNLLSELQERRGLSYLFVAHDLAVVRVVADRVLVMHLGKIVESGTSDELFAGAAHPYTRALLSAIPVPDPSAERNRRRIVLGGELPSATDPPSGCRFRTRCWKAEARCAEEEPALVDRDGVGHPVACHFPESSASS